MGNTTNNNASVNKRKICSICGRDIAATKPLLDGRICDVCQVKTLFPTQRFRNLTVKDVITQMDKRQQFSERIEKFEESDRVGRFFAIDKTNKLFMAYGKDKDNKHTVACFPWSDLISFQLLEDGKVVSRRGVGGAVIGGALFGATGAVIGSSAGRKHKEKTTQIDVKIVTHDDFFPQITINLLDSSVKAGGRAHREANEEAQRILSLLTIIADSMQSTQSDVSGISPAEEIEKFKNLMDKGIISPEEFEAKKAQLLGL